MTNFLPHYHERNMKALAQLGDKTKVQALKVYDEAIKAKINILFVQTIRTLAQQKIYFEDDKSKTMKSYHLVGQAFDVVLCNGADDKWDWYSKPDFKKFIAICKKHGFTWGGDWDNDGNSRDETFIDSPHFQYSQKLAYGTDTFKTKGKAELPKPKAKHTLHSVVLGDVLGVIAKKYGVSVGSILEINPQIKNRNEIFVGNVLKIPLK